MNAPKALRDVVGAHVRLLRERAGARQEDVARSARGLGLAWSRQKVDELERGKKAIRAEELILLPGVLSRALDQGVSMADQFDNDELITLSARTHIAARDVPAELCGTDRGGTFVRRTGRDPVDMVLDAHLALDPHVIDLNRWVRRAKSLGLGDTSSSDLEAIEESSGEPEARAARRVGEHGTVFAALSHRLWGRSLSAERDARVANGLPGDASTATVRAKRGRVTRELVAEIRAFIDRAEKTT
jgi:transcriptional regulator with XRE-family HTH domain